MAGAGFGTSGATTTFGIKENNYLGKGISLNANATINESSVKENSHLEIQIIIIQIGQFTVACSLKKLINYQILVTKLTKLDFRLVQVLSYMMI